MTEKSTQAIIHSLKKAREQIASALQVEPFKVLHNSTIEEIAKKRPETKEELLLINGLGEKKVAKYGKLIIEIVRGKDIRSDIKQDDEVMSVSEFVSHTNFLLSQESSLVVGEVFEVKKYDNYTFFSLLDENDESKLSCFAWNSIFSQSGMILEEGMVVKIQGSCQIYERTGNLNFRVQAILLTGEGELKKAFEQLKAKLEVEGLFHTDKKKPVPQFVKKIGLITSAKGDARVDFLKHLIPVGFDVKMYGVRVEGVYSSGDIVRAIEYFNKTATDCDVLVVTRGGGSLESLQSFNSEEVVRAIFSSKIPVISAVGHEQDITIADLVADIRASTPTDAAKILSDGWKKAEYSVDAFEENVLRTFRERVFEKRQAAENILPKFYQYFKNSFQSADIVLSVFSSNSKTMEFLIREKKVLTDTCQKSIYSGLDNVLFEFREKIKDFRKRLLLSDPALKLKQGYSIVRGLDSKILKDGKDIKIHDTISVTLHKGSLTAEVKKKDS